MRQGRRTRIGSRALAAIAGAAACLPVPAAAGAATVVTPDASGTLSITGDAGVNAVALRNGTVEPYQLYVYAESPTGSRTPTSSSSPAPRSAARTARRS